MDVVLLTFRRTGGRCAQERLYLYLKTLPMVEVNYEEISEAGLIWNNIRLIKSNKMLAHGPSDLSVSRTIL